MTTFTIIYSTLGSQTSVLSQAIVGHLVGDYLLQNDYMASNKKLNDKPCLLHCLVWSLCVMIFSGWILLGWWSILIFSILFSTHFLQDRTQIIKWYMKKNHQEGFMKEPLAPWSLIVVDNVWHIVVLYLIDKFVCYFI